MLFALGLGDQVVAVTHECDWPPEAASLPHLTRTVVPAGLSAAEIDRTVRETVGAGRPLYELDARAPRGARSRPDRHPGGVRRVRRLLRRRRRRRRDAAEPPARAVARPDDARRGARRHRAARRRGRRAGPRAAPAARAGATPHRRRRAAPSRTRRARACCARVARPAVHRGPLGAGDDRAGRRRGRARARPASARARPSGRRSRRPRPTSRSRCRAATTRERSAEEARSLRATQLAALGAERVVAVDASAYFSRPGPRLVDGHRAARRTSCTRTACRHRPTGREHVELVD